MTIDDFNEEVFEKIKKYNDRKIVKIWFTEKNELISI
jgi:hypothetical protein